MKIGNGYNQYIKAVEYNQKQPQAAKTETARATVQEPAVKVEISEEAKRLAQLQTETAPSERAQEIKRALQNGTFHVSPEKIAQNMVAAMKEQGESAE